MFFSVRQAEFDQLANEKGLQIAEGHAKEWRQAAWKDFGK